MDHLPLRRRDDVRGRHWWRYRADQFGWTSGSTQLFERKILGWAGPAFHYGALAAVGGHVIGLMIPKSLTEAIGMSESTYRWFSRDRRRRRRRGLRRRLRRARLPARHQRPRAPHDVAHRPARLPPAGRADRARLLDDLRAQPVHQRRPTTTATSMSAVVALAVHPAARRRRPSRARTTVYQVHAIIAWAFWALFPFSRLVHAWSIPLQYLGRPYILYRRRYPPPPAGDDARAPGGAPVASSRSRRSRSRSASTPGA